VQALGVNDLKFFEPVYSTLKFKENIFNALHNVSYIG